ncbi:MAG TPA: magnesium transporter [Roseiflexaceae bacterium]|jgi:magnesium transporter|nr:magnesium transporter [Roseiflexaceae bacterium]
MLSPVNLEKLEQQVSDALENEQYDDLQAFLSGMHPADIADVLDRLGDAEKLRVFRLLDRGQAAEVLGETAFDTTRELIEQLPPDEAGDLLDMLPMDDVAEILGEDVPDRQQDLLAAMEPADADEVRALLQYPPKSAGRLMTDRFVRVRGDMTAAAAIQYLRKVDAEVETINDLYVLDREGCLCGVAGLREIITAPPGQCISEFMATQLITTGPGTDQEEVARLVSQYNLSALPVLAANRRMLGIVTVDDVIDVLVEESTEDVLRFGGVEIGATDESYFSTPILRAVRRRVVWLLLLFFTGTITVNVLGFFEDELQEVVALSFFIPLLIGTGGNTGAQTVSTLIRGLALGEVRLHDIWKVLLRELTGGLLLGLLLGVVAFGMALANGHPMEIALVVGSAIVAICTWANVMGALVPLAARKFRLDPALVSAPMITTLVDATGLAIYLMIAKMILHL